MTEPDPGREPWIVFVSGPAGRLIAALAILEVVYNFLGPVLEAVADLFLP